MTDIKTIEKLFTDIGGSFITPVNEIQEKLKNVKAFIFDWDGVFNNGMKTGEQGSLFSDVDAMGTNMLRFNYYLNNNKTIPLSFIITGSNNQSAIKLANREKFNGCYYQAKFKKEAIDMLCEKHNLNYENFAFVFDDILDIELTKICGLSFQVKRDSNPLFNQFTIGNKYCNYATANAGHEHGLREICELIIGLTGDYSATVNKRVAFRGDYEEYLALRQQTTTEVMNLQPDVLKNE